ncbi:hypothetical protein GKZ68_09415 [Hymenobacter sp. BRD128]|uniref:hypothetical protein n=1 Tax=Hymenobacter sp. BRD128 TaxID=2675878 RepID=UPI001566928E|nr:hypothetical protein [Hymenobacter sp. BRD128]QKG56820.1 hypothetical protein GKZ68_09415 [Hymenobacter sp. BRD128]
MPATLTLTEPATFYLHYDAATQLLRGRWPTPVLDADLRGHYAELLAQAQAHAGCRYWLLDMRQRNWHMPSFGAWFSAEFAAPVRAALGQPVFIACLLSARHQTAAESARSQAIQRACARHDVYPYFFASEEAALDWLHYQQGLY